MPERLQKVLARAGIASRRRAEELIARGEVEVNGHVAELGESVDADHDVVTVRGERLGARAEHRYLAFHKPPGYVTSTRSTHGETTVFDLVPFARGLNPVGRLDKDTSGLLLLTNDGAWGNTVMHPRYGVDKEYLAAVRGRPSPAALARLRQGVALPDGEVTAPTQVQIVGEENGRTRLRLTVREGKKRQIRLMLQAVGHSVVTLHRVRVGPIRLGTLPEGQWRDLAPEEVESIRERGERAAPRGS